MKNKENLKEIAMERVKQLFKEASSNPKMANRYVLLARKIAMKVNLKIPKEFKRKYCKHCNSYLRPGVNCRIRNNRSQVVYKCLDCNKFMRFKL
jgi:ribonuclease P protein subunit RPR2